LIAKFQELSASTDDHFRLFQECFFLSDKIVWVAAYPKTGSTWLRAIIQQILAPGDRAKDAIPSLHKVYPAEAPIYPIMGTEAKLLRTHSHPHQKFYLRAMENRSDEIIGIITIQRHPLDVLLSQLNYSFVMGDERSFKNGALKKAEQIISDGEIDHYIDAFIEAGGCPEHVERCGTYVGFFEKWREYSPNASRLHLRYEEMVEDPKAGMREIQSFLQLPDVRIDEVAAKIEDRTQVDGKFYWRKRAFNYRDLLPTDSIRRFEEGFSDELTELGYESRA
jgi:hypothetical protein